MKKYFVEFIGTFFLVFTVGNVVIAPGDAGAMAPLAIGAILMTMIFAGGHISGGHFNPAVTIGVWRRGKCATSDVPGYFAAQFLAAIAAAFVVGYLKDSPTMKGAIVPTGQGLVAEFLGTFALVWVVLNAATAKGTSGNSFYGLAIGFTVLAMAYAVGGVSGGAFNPAVALGITVMGIKSASSIWIFLVAEAAAGFAAAAAFSFANPDDK
jgi:aquaporin Z